MTPPDSPLTAGSAALPNEQEYPRDYRRAGASGLVTMLTPRRGVAAARAFQSLPALAQRVAMEPVLPVTALIFHCSRCGSTLLARLLAADPGNRVFAEPEALQKFLTAHAAALRRGERLQELRTFVQAFGTSPLPGERGLVLKLTSRSLLYLPALRAALPQASFVYLFRDPVEVVASLHNRPPPFLHDDQRAGLAAAFGTTPPNLADLHPVHWYAWYVDRNLRLALKHHAHFAEAIDYADHTAGYLDFARRLRPDGSPLPPTAAGLVLGRHSKNPNTAFVPRDLSSWPLELAEATRRIAREAYLQWQQKTKKRSQGSASSDQSP